MSDGQEARGSRSLRLPEFRIIGQANMWII